MVKYFDLTCLKLVQHPGNSENVKTSMQHRAPSERLLNVMLLIQGSFVLDFDIGFDTWKILNLVMENIDRCVEVHAWLFGLNIHGWLKIWKKTYMWNLFCISDIISLSAYHKWILWHWLNFPKIDEFVYRYKSNFLNFSFL